MMAVKSHLLPVLPLLLAATGFILTTLCLFAGHKDGFMEEYAVARLNTSAIGQNIFSSNSSKSDDDDDDDGGFFHKLKDKFEDAKDDIVHKLDDIAGDIADKLAQDLGVSEWYSIHVMDACEGMYKPNATSPHAGLNTTNCTDSKPNHRLNLTEILNHELEIGPFDINLADIKWPSDIQDKLDDINNVLLGLFVLFVLAMAFSGLCVLMSLGALLKPAATVLTLLNLAVASLAALMSLINSIIITVAVDKGVKAVNKVGHDVGVSASKGTKFLGLSWGATAVLLAAAAFWMAHSCCNKKRSDKKMRSRRKWHY